MKYNFLGFYILFKKKCKEKNYKKIKKKNDINKPSVEW